MRGLRFNPPPPPHQHSGAVDRNVCPTGKDDAAQINVLAIISAERTPAMEEPFPPAFPEESCAEETSPSHCESWMKCLFLVREMARGSAADCGTEAVAQQAHDLLIQIVAAQVQGRQPGQVRRARQRNDTGGVNIVAAEVERAQLGEIRRTGQRLDTAVADAVVAQ